MFVPITLVSSERKIIQQAYRDGAGKDQILTFALTIHFKCHSTKDHIRNVVLFHAKNNTNSLSSCLAEIESGLKLIPISIYG